MPLLGNIETGTLQELLQITQETQANVVLGLESEQFRGELHINAGQLVRIEQNHSRIEHTLEELLTLQQGSYSVYRPDEPTPTRRELQEVPVWLLDEDDSQRESLQDALEQMGYSVGLLANIETLQSFLQKRAPKLLLLGAKTAHTHISKLPKDLATRCSTLLVGPKTPPHELTELVAGSLPWPTPSISLEQNLAPWLSPSNKAKPYNAGSEADLLQGLGVLSSLSSPINPQFFMVCSPKYRSLLLQDKLPKEWKDWLLRPEEKQSAAEWIATFPGPPKIAQMTIQYLTHTGILEVSKVAPGLFENPTHSSSSDESPSEKPSLSTQTASDAPAPSFVLIKVIIFGLRGKRRDELSKSLREISQTQASRIPRDHEVQIPALPKSELARIPLRNDSLMIVYSALTETAIEQLMEQIGSQLTNFLFFVDLDNSDELNYIRDIRKKLRQSYPVNDLVMVSSFQGKDTTQLHEHLGLPSPSLWHPVEDFNVRSTYKLLRILLLRTTSSENTVTPSPSTNS